MKLASGKWLVASGKWLVASGKWLVASEQCQEHSPLSLWERARVRALSPPPSPLSPPPSSLSTIHYPLSTSPSALTTSHWPLATSSRGISLLEVLISIFVLSVGLFGVIALIPLAKYSIAETNKSDRTGACGRAALHEIKVRRLLDTSQWQPAPGAITVPAFLDPLGRAKVGGGSVSTLTIPVGGTDSFNRYSLLNSSNVALTPAQAEAIFNWHDELKFALPEDMPAGKTPPNGERPAGLFVQADGSAGTTTTATPAADENFSWFLTVAPTGNNVFSVAAVVCHKRLFTQTAGTTTDGEDYVTLTATATGTATGTAPIICLSAPAAFNALPGSPGYGGVSITIPSTANSKWAMSGKWPVNWNLGRNDWVLLYSTRRQMPSGPPVLLQASWYRVVNVGNYNGETNITLVGPDWHGSDYVIGAGGGANYTYTVTIVSIQGVTGVYTNTIKLDNDAVWRK